MNNEDFEFFAVCHAKKDTVNKGIELLNIYNEEIDAKNKILFKKVNLLTSFSHLYKTNTEIYIPKVQKKLMIDSGAYDFIIKQDNKDYPYDTAEYFDTIYNKIEPELESKDHSLDYLVTMDYICAPDDHKNNMRLIKKTVSNTAKLMKIFESNQPNFKLVPCIQGRNLEEYQACAKMLAEAGIFNDRSMFDMVGIGSIANRRDISNVRDIISKLSYYIKTELNIKDLSFHLFGTSLNVVKSKIVSKKICSFDSLAWTFPYRFGRIKCFTGKRMIELNTHKKLKEPEFYYTSLLATLKYVDYMKVRYKREESTFFDVMNEKKISEELQNNILTFTGNKLVFLQPKNSILSREEFYNIYRCNFSRYMSFLLSRPDRMRKDRKNFEEWMSELRENPEILNDDKLDVFVKIMYNINKKEIKRKEEVKNIQQYLSKLILMYNIYNFKDNSKFAKGTIDCSIKSNFKKNLKIQSIKKYDEETLIRNNFNFMKLDKDFLIDLYNFN